MKNIFLGSISASALNVVGCMSLLAMLPIMVMGCGKADLPPAPATPATPAAVAPTMTVTRPADETPVDVSDRGESAPDKLVETNATAPSTGGATKPNNQGETEPAPVAKLPKVQPTAEQLARWTKLDFDPLQLLAVRESDKIGLVTCMAPLPDGKGFILAGKKVTLWSIDGEKPDHAFLDLTSSQQELFIRCVAVSHDGQWFAAGDSGGRLHIWSLTDRNEIVSKELYKNDISELAISPDSLEIATTSFGSEVTIWGAEKLNQKNRFTIDTNGVEAIKYLSPGVLVAAGETTSSWNTVTGKLRQQLSPGRYNFSLARSSDNQTFVFGTEAGLQLWDIAEAKRAATLVGSFANNEIVEFSPDGKLLVTGNGSMLRIWEIAAAELRQVIDGYGSTIIGIHWLPNTNMILVATENGRTRLWGTAKSGMANKMPPLHHAIEMPDPASNVAASPAQLLEAIDMRSVAMLPGGFPTMRNEDMLSYVVAAKPEEAMLFLRYDLGNRGWTEVSAVGAAPGTVQFLKNGFSLSISSYEAAESKTNISMNRSGNVDLRKLPKFDSAPVDKAYDGAGVVIYRTKADLLEIETTLLRKMHDAGWTAYSRLNSSHNEEGDKRDLTFIQNSATVQVSIGRFPVEPDSYTIQYTAFLTLNSLPIPADSGYVEFDGSTEPYLVASTSMNLEKTREFYDKELAAQGWLPREFRRTLKEKNNWLPYIQGQKDLLIGLEAMDNGRTRIKVGDGLENSSWQLAKSKPEQVDAASKGIIEAATFPILNASKLAKFDVEGKSINFQIDAIGLLDVADRYTKELATLGWEHNSRGIKEADFLLMTFKKDNAEITLRGRVHEGNSMVSAEGSGLGWSNPLPGGKQVISYETWLRRNNRQASLGLLDEYTAEMRSITETK